MLNIDSFKRHSTAPYKVPQISCNPEDDLVIPEEELFENDPNVVNVSRGPKKQAYNWVDRLHIPKAVKEYQSARCEKLRKENEMKQFTGKPQINPKSRELFKDISKMFQWQKKKDAQKSERVQKILEEKDKENDNLRKPWELSKGSIKYLAQTGRLESKERIEIALLRRGKEYFEVINTTCIEQLKGGSKK